MKHKRNNALNQPPNIAWRMTGAKFHFADSVEYEDWKKERQVWFTFDPRYSDDSGKGVFQDPRTACRYFPITDENGGLEIDLEEDGPVISGWVKFYVPLLDTINQESLNEWVLKKGGWGSARFDIDSEAIHILYDSGTEWELLPTA